MEDEWRYLSGSDDCSISHEGEVVQGEDPLEPYTKPETGRHRWVDIPIRENYYDYQTGLWTRTTGHIPTLVWQLMISEWFTNYPRDCVVHFLDGDEWNCSADNIRAWSNDQQRIILVRKDRWGYGFDKRLRGSVEIVELDIRVKGPSEAARVVKGTRSGVSRVLSGELERHRGFHFRWTGD